MALVFKIKFEDTLRRWLVSDDLNSSTFSLSLAQVEDKIRQLFNLSPTSSLVITYVDKDDDIVTLGDDRDLLDACLVQKLNPLRLNVQETVSADNSSTVPSPSFTKNTEDVNVGTFFKANAFLENLQNVMEASTQVLDPIQAITKKGTAFKTFLENWTNRGGISSRKTSCDELWGSSLDKGLAGLVADNHALVPYPRPHVFHCGVQCDSCGMNPIEGPRYKSLKVPNYDLCSSCYDLMRREGDFEKLESPSPIGSSWRSSFMWAGNPECPFSGQAMNYSPLNGYYRKLDARFDKDVTVFDGTEIMPGTRFTKIWRMTNNGTLPWPQGTQLVHIGGNALGSMRVVNLELPEGGLPSRENVDISVDLTAPDDVGRYVSHWRLISPSGRGFGHRIWVMIQVTCEGKIFHQFEGSLKERENLKESSEGRGLVEGIIAPVPNKLSQENIASSNVATMQEDRHGIFADGGIEIDDGEKFVNVNEVIHETNFMKCNSLEGSLRNVDAMLESGQGVLGDERQEYMLGMKMDTDVDGFSIVEKPVETLKVAGGIEGRTQFVNKDMSEANQETCLQLLESRGFEDQGLNHFLLMKNNQNLQGTLEDLLLYARWDGAIRNLRGMGFNDQATNIPLLFKHNGSIKLVVKDLVKMEKENEQKT